ncbi:MAG: hypothetical protein HY211_07705 [Candidatus Omnitrophica bacterium]|nr:hypothetical protein [Candidatus Omnitrophota bacterium]
MSRTILINVTPAEAGVIHTTVSRRFLALFLICTLLAGCSPQWRGKFTRKKKGVSGPQPILTLQSNVQATHPPAIRYQEHFAYWKSWHSELLGSLGEIRKRDMTYLNGSIGELRSLAQLLSGPPSEKLKGILVELNDLQEQWEGRSQAWSVSSSERTRLEQLERQINRDFYYSKVKEWIPSGTD